MTSTASCIQTEVPTIATGLTTVNACYQHFFQRPMPQYAIEQACALLEKCQADMICAILEYTFDCAPRPSWSYALAVARNQLQLGSRTAEDFNRACSRFRTETHTMLGTNTLYRPGYYQKQVSAQAYDQRAYNPAEVNDMSEEDIAAASML